MRTPEDYYAPLDADFSAVYEAAMEGRRAIEMELLSKGKDFHCRNWTCLQIGDRIVYKVWVTEWGQPINREVSLHTPDNKDCTVEEIKALTAQALEQLRKCTIEGRIKELEEEIEKLRNGEEA